MADSMEDPTPVPTEAPPTPVRPDELLSPLLEGIRDYAIYGLDPEGRVTSWNAGAERLKGWKREQIIGQHFSRFYTPEDIARGTPYAHLDEAHVNGRSEMQGWRVRADGSRFWASATLTAIRDGSGMLRGFAKVTRDDTERRRLSFLGDASAILGASLEYQQTLSQVAALAVPFLGDWCAVDIMVEDRPVRLAVAHVDPAKVKLAIELNQRYPVRPADTSGVMQVIRTGQPVLVPEVPDEMLAASVVDPEHLRVARELHIRSAIIVPLKAGARGLGALTLVLSETSRRYDQGDLDVATELARRCAMAIDNARAHEELRRQAEFRERLVAIVGHDLRTPLHAISGTAQALLRQGIEPKAATRIANSADRMQHIIDELLDFARSRLGGGVPVERKPVDLRAICHEVVEELEVSHPGAEIRCIAGAGDLRGEWDPQRLAQVLSNLVGNALEYGADGTPVTIRMAPEKGSVVVSVHNGGNAIPRDVLPYVFDPFRQGVPVAGGRKRGLGLGLYIAKEIVVAHGGTIEATSVADDGTTFTVRLPRK